MWPTITLLCCFWYLHVVATHPMSLRGGVHGGHDPTEDSGDHSIDRDLASCEELRSFGSSVTPETVVSWFSMGDIPYSLEERYCLNSQLRDLDLSDPNGPSFIIHVGDIKKGTRDSPCDAEAYNDIAEILTHPSNARNYDPRDFFFVPGDNEFSDCPDEDDAWQKITDHFGPGNPYGFGTLSSSHSVHRQIHVERLTGVNRWENFAFFKDKVLFMGLNMIGGPDIGDEHIRVKQNFHWVKEQLKHHAGNDMKAAVLFGHAPLVRSRKTYFGDDFFHLLRDEYKDLPVMYLHGDYHDYCVHYPDDQNPNLVDVEVEDGGYAPPLLVSVIRNPADDTYAFDIDQRGGLYETGSLGSCPLVYDHTWTTPTPAPHTTKEIVHYDRAPSPTFRFGLCEGDCDDDDECQPGLRCFQRRRFETVPGCLGDGVKGKDYCIYDGTRTIPVNRSPTSSPTPVPTMPQTTLAPRQNTPPPTPAPTLQPTATSTPQASPAPQDVLPELNYLGSNPDELLGVCEGDCDRDYDCKPGLVCGKRNRGDPVPGCSGEPRGSKDYCIVPFLKSDPAPPTSTGTSNNLRDVGDDGSPRSAYPLGLCEGDCDRSSDCQSGLKCFKRKRFERIPGCLGDGTEGTDYCYQPNR